MVTRLGLIITSLGCILCLIESDCYLCFNVDVGKIDG
jgi:hypothetical protein